VLDGSRKPPPGLSMVAFPRGRDAQHQGRALAAAAPRRRAPSRRQRRMGTASATRPPTRSAASRRPRRWRRSTGLFADDPQALQVIEGLGQGLIGRRDQEGATR
jgi:hypothetical protein